MGEASKNNVYTIEDKLSIINKMFCLIGRTLAKF